MKQGETRVPERDRLCPKRDPFQARGGSWPFALYASFPIRFPASRILGSVESECGCTPACIARRNAAARVTKDMRVCEFAKEQERKERTKRKKERESNITVASIQAPTVKVHDIVKVTNIDSKAFASHPREWNE